MLGRVKGGFKRVVERGRGLVGVLGEKKVKGYCHCCKSSVEFVIMGEWLRDQFLCKRCGSIPRQRHLQYVLGELFPGWNRCSIHESSPSNNYISQFSENYSFSQFLPETTFGDCDENGVRSENLEDLTLKSESVDVFITQDVFEHIFSPDRAAKEIARVLAPGGIHIFTAPKHKGCVKSFKMANLLGDGSIEFLHQPPEYHGNPVSDGKSLVTWRYGNDFEYLISKWSGLPVATYVTRDWDLGIYAEFNEVFVMRKPTS